MVDLVRGELQGLAPAGGLLLIPKLPWHRIYGTNFDQLLERAYSIADVDLIVRRSNSDYNTLASPGVVEYCKLHGCITTDTVFGHRSRMLLTVRDYEEFDKYRQTTFRQLTADLTTKTALIVGQSLADPHLRELVNDVARLHASAGTTGRVFLLAYERDEDRAEIFEQRGITVTFGGVDDLMHALVEARPPHETGDFVLREGATPVPSEILATAIDVRHAIALPPNPKRMFNGAPASYADVVGGLTFTRAVQRRLQEGLKPQKPLLALFGVAGVGKTTLARQIALQSMNDDIAIWEHNSDFPFIAAYWIEYEERLRKDGQRALLVVDDCIPHLGQLNRVMEALGETEEPSLLIVTTASTGQWKSRSKSRYVFSRGHAERVSRLVDADLEQLLNLIEREPQIRSMVETTFARLPRNEQLRRLRDRCSADMFVCLKNIFASEGLDTILLREFAELDSSEQDIYRNVAALEALDARVHRQLVLRILGIEVGMLESHLRMLEGIVDEFDIKPQAGIFGWKTRHEVIAKRIADYKFADQGELYSLFRALIDTLNPGEWLELDTARALCREDYGLMRLQSDPAQLELLTRLADLLPSDHVVRHALVRKYLNTGTIEETATALRAAADAIGMTAVLARYRIYLTIRRAEETEGILEEDRRAMLAEAVRFAKQNLDAHPQDKHAYRVYGQVAATYARRTSDTSLLEDAIKRAQGAEESILDPDLRNYRRNFERDLRLIGERQTPPDRNPLQEEPTSDDE